MLELPTSTHFQRVMITMTVAAAEIAKIKMATTAPATEPATFLDEQSSETVVIGDDPVS